METYWLTIIITVLIVAIIFDGIRRMRRARRDSIKMSLRGHLNKDSLDDEHYGSEFPNGGARPSNHQIDPKRIQKIRSQYNFGEELPTWGKRFEKQVSETIDKLSGDTARQKPEERIEPSFNDIMDCFEENESDNEGFEDELVLYNDEEDKSPKKLTNDTDNSLRINEDLSDDLDLGKKTSPDSNAQGFYRKHQPPSQKSHEKVGSESACFQGQKNRTTKKEDFPSEKLGTSSSKSKPTDNLDPKIPVQSSLNLEESVPMLMDTLDESDLADTKPNNSSGPDKAVSQIRADASEGTKSEISRDRISENGNTSPNKPFHKSKHVAQTEKTIAQPQPVDVLVIHVKAPSGEYFYGSDLLDLILENDLRYGDMGIFHRHADENGGGLVLFSMANMIKPGTFDLHNFEQFRTIGLSFFLTLPSHSENHMKRFELMLSVVQKMAEDLDGELKDEHRSVLTKQTIEHYRERIRDFSRRQQLLKTK